MRALYLVALALVGIPFICGAQTPSDDVAEQILQPRL